MTQDGAGQRKFDPHEEHMRGAARAVRGAFWRLLDEKNGVCPRCVAIGMILGAVQVLVEHVPADLPAAQQRELLQEFSADVRKAVDAIILDALPAAGSPS